MNKYYIKNLIFGLFDNARIMFNDYYNGKESYSEKDIETILLLIKCMEENIKEIKEKCERF